MSIQRVIAKAIGRAGAPCRVSSRDPAPVIAASIQPVSNALLPQADRLGRREPGRYRLYAAAGGTVPEEGEILEQAGVSYLVEELTTVYLGETPLYLKGLLRKTREEDRHGAV